MKPLGSLAALLAAIRDDAAAEAESIAREADAAVAKIAGDRESCPPPDHHASAVAAAQDRARILVSQEDWDDARTAIAEREDWIAKALAMGATHLRERQPADAVRAELAALAREAIARLPAGAIDITVSEVDLPLLDRQWRASLVPDDPDRVRTVAGSIDGGCIARSADGRASFDNTYAARAERLQAAWRAELFAIYERATPNLAPRPVAEAS